MNENAELSYYQQNVEFLKKSAEIHELWVVGDEFTKAAEEGDLSTVKRMTEKYKFGCDAKACALGLAATEGHIDIVKFLIRNNAPEYWDYAVRAAVECGHLSIVEFLLNNRPEIPTELLHKLMKIANENEWGTEDNVKIIKFLKSLQN